VHAGLWGPQEEIKYFSLAPLRCGLGGPVAACPFAAPTDVDATNRKVVDIEKHLTSKWAVSVASLIVHAATGPPRREKYFILI